MGCRQSVIKEEKKILTYYITLCNIYFYLVHMKNLQFDITNYMTNYEYINKNSQNNFKKLEKKQGVRLNFINEVKRLMIHYETCDIEKEEYVNN
jgi:hypothetical protein